ncbi:K16698 tuaG; teichuronic acid biosynthesis glycosyltransferase TuaG [Candidatus Pelagibacterales bacterium]
MKSVAFLTTIFPQNEKFLKSFLDSLSAQTYKDFDLVIVNDSFKNLNYYKDLYSNLNIVNINSSGTSAKNREVGINYCIEKNYDILIFGDSDDYFKNNRIEKSIKILNQADIVVNDLSLFNENTVYNKRYLSNRVKNLQIIEFEFIKNKNIFGFSNSAIKLFNQKKLFIPNDLVAVDWYIFSNFLLKGYKAVFTDETISFYRQYEQNIIGLKQLDEKSFNKVKNIKIQHFKALSVNGNQFDNELKILYSLNFDKRREIKNPLWWEL